MVGINGDLVMGMLEGASAVVTMITVQVDTVAVAVAVDTVAVDRSVVGRLLGKVDSLCLSSPLFGVAPG